MVYCSECWTNRCSRKGAILLQFSVKNPSGKVILKTTDADLATERSAPEGYTFDIAMVR